MQVDRSVIPAVDFDAGWKARLERSLLPIAFRTRAFRPMRYLNRHKAVILTYHGFTDERTHPGIQNHERKHVHVDDFRSQVAFLKANYHVLGLADLVERLASRRPVPKRAAVITMDDGYGSTCRLALPVLRELGVPATVFLATDYVENKRFLWTDRVEFAIDRARSGTYDLPTGREVLALTLNGPDSRMRADRDVRSALKALPQTQREAAVDRLEQTLGVAIDAATAAPIYQPLEWTEAAAAIASGLMAMGSHTHTHAILSRCETPAALAELSTSKTIIERRLDVPCELFCYPNGRRGDFDDRTRRLVKDAGYSCALTTVHGMNGTRADRYELKRYPVTGRMMEGELVVRLSGLVEWPSSMGRAATAMWRGGSRRDG